VTFFNETKWPKHHGIPVSVGNARTLQPTKEEESQGILAVEVAPVWCVHPQCRKRRLYYRFHFLGGVTPVNKAKPGQVAELLTRLKLAKESDWVWGCDTETSIKIKRMVR
jgi:hypothetical protein